ncbi:amidohydrolase family protein [Sinomicrobium oceani]|uniref:amidohydrolase family protein n=1 Tax=Sinomicrobium oceani TaxID=1150368 RepID=UPI00227B9C63|nr:amidohydrolase family protein [Sinomicrobium oceani]
MTYNSFLRVSLGLFLYLILYGCGGIHNLTKVRSSEIKFSTSEITNPNIDISPDGKTILFDVLGDLYTVPIEGGKAKALTNGLAWNAQGKFSPNGEHIAFLSDRSGTINFNVMDRKGNGLNEFTIPSLPLWVTPILWHSNDEILTLNQDTTLTAVNIISGKKKNIYHGKQMSDIYYFGSISSNSKEAFSNIYGKGLHKIDLQTSEDRKLNIAAKTDILKVKVSSDNSKIFYLAKDDRKGRKDFYSVLRYFDSDKSKDVFLTDSIVGYAATSFVLTTDNKYIITGRLGKIVKIALDSGNITEIPITIPVGREIVPRVTFKQRSLDDKKIVSKVIRWPIYLKDRSLLVYGTFGKLYVSNLKTGKTKRLTTLKEGIFEYSPSLSIDKQWIVFTTISKGAQGHLMAIPLDGGNPIRLTKELGRYANPTWSNDGKFITYISDTTQASLGIKSLHTGPNYKGWQLHLKRIPFQRNNTESNEVVQSEKLALVTPIAVVATRFYPIPRFSTDGTQILVASHILKNGEVLKSPTLISNDIQSKKQKKIIQFPRADEALLSPDTHSLALIREGRLWVLNVPANIDKDSIPEISFDNQFAQLISEDNPAHVSWEDNNTLIWTKGNVIYRQGIDDKKASVLYEVNISESVPYPRGVYALMGARVVTMNGSTVIENGGVLVKNDRIFAVGEKQDIPITDQTKVFDLKGKTIIPGLIDVHCHTDWANKEFWMKSDPAYLGNLAYGVTTIYDPSSTNTDFFGKAEMIESGILVGPRLFSSGIPILGSSSDQTANRKINNAKEAERALENLLPYRRYLGPIKEYTQPNRRSRQLLSRAAQKYGLVLTSHPNMYLNDKLSRIVDGYLGIEHPLYKFTLYDDVLKFMSLTGMHNTPTLLASAGFSGVLKEEVKLNNKLNHFFPEELIEFETRGLRTDCKKRNNCDYNKTAVHIATKNLANISNYKGNLSLGAHGSGLPGFGTHLEMRTYTIGGISPYDILKAATLTGAKKLNLDMELGSIEVGKKADMVILNSNILDDIENSLDIEYVIKNGVIYFGDTLNQL